MAISTDESLMRNRHFLVRVIVLICILTVTLLIGFDGIILDSLGHWKFLHSSVITSKGTYSSDDKKYELQIDYSSGGLVHYRVIDSSGTILTQGNAGTTIMSW